MDIKNQIKQFNKIMHKLYLEKQWATSKLGRLIRTAIFKFGFSQCRYCVFFTPADGDHRTTREESILTSGKCDFSNIAGADINKKTATRFKRCPAFVTALFNTIGHTVPKGETKNILLQRCNYFFSWWTIIIAIIAATISWIQTIETKKERIKAEEALQKSNQAKESINKIATVLLKISYVVADGSGRYGGMSTQHINKIKDYQKSIDIYLDKNLEAEIKNDIKQIDGEINLRNKKNP